MGLIRLATRLGPELQSYRSDATKQMDKRGGWLLNASWSLPSLMVMELRKQRLCFGVFLGCNFLSSLFFLRRFLGSKFPVLFSDPFPFSFFFVGLVEFENPHGSWLAR